MAANALTMTLETVTPLFLAGAEPRGQPELRPPSFRGALRYWLRAALGGVLGDDPETVARTEAAVFGSTNPEWGGAGAVTVRVYHESDLTSESFQRGGTVRVAKSGRTLPQPTGRDYLYWSMAPSGNAERGNFIPAKKYFPAGTSLTVELRLRSPVPRGTAPLSDAVAALWLLVQLGGLGSRARRTGGSMSAQGPLVWDGLQFHLTGTNVAEIADEIGDGLRHVREQFSAHGTATPHVPSAFDVLHPATCQIRVLGVWPQPRDAIEAVGAALRDFRTYREPDRTNVARWLRGEAIPTVERAVFGLPIQYRYTNRLSGTIQAGGNRPELDRRASPLWLKVSKTVSGKGVAIATLFLTQFLPENAGLYATQNQRQIGPKIAAPNNYHLIEQWLHQSFPQAAEVHYA